MPLTSSPHIDIQAGFDAIPGLYLVLLPDAPRYTIVAVSDAYLEATTTKRELLLGRGLFDVFPDGSARVTASNLRTSLDRVLSGRIPDTAPANEHWWTSPVLGPGGEVALIIHVVDDGVPGEPLTRARDLFEQASDSIFVSDIDGRYTDVNAAACELLGYSRDEWPGKSIADLLRPEDLPRLAATREQLLTPGAVHVGEWTLLKKDGTPILTEVSAKMLPDGRWQAFVRDISERKRIETELRDANAFLDAIIEHIPLMVFIKESGSLRFLRFNHAGEALLGWSREELLGKTDFDFWPLEQARSFVEEDRKTVDGEVHDIGVEPIQTRHQGIRLLHTKKVQILGPSGPRYLLGISEDVTERTRVEEERRLLSEASATLASSIEYEETLAAVTRLVVERVADWCAVDLLEDDGRLRRLKVACADTVDAATCATLERMPPDRDLPYLARFVHEGGRSFLVENFTQQHLEAFAQDQEHLEALMATGITSLIGVPLLLRGKSLGVLLFAASHHHRVYQQRDLHWAEALADRCAVAIQNACLYRASLEASRLRDQVLGVVAHDLRTPLSTILMQETALRQRPGIDAQLDVIQRAATRMNHLIQDLLDVGRIEANELPLHKERLSVNELVTEVGLEQAPGSSSLDLRIDLPRDDVEIEGDRDRLVQVFENLIGNAIKFTAPGGHILVGASVKEHEVVFWVADDGCGIAADALPHVFEQFWQATRGDRRGAGLGLLIVKGIVEAHGGHVWVESTLGRGSTFYFAIPAADPAPHRAAPTIH